MARPRKTTAAKAETKKVEAPVTEAVVETVVEETVVEEAVVEEAVKAEPAKKAPAKKTAAKKAVNANVMLEFNGQSVSTDLIVENIKKAFEAEGNKLSAIKDFQVYVKPEDNAAYYVINQDITGKVNLF